MTDKPVATIAQSVPELEDLKENLLRHGLPLGIGISLAVCIAVGVLFVRGRTSSAEADAQRILSSARAMPDLEQVVNNYPKTAAAPLALLKLARANYDTGNYQLALQQYDTFAATYAEHPFLAASELGRAHCLEAQGRIQDALTQYTSFATTQPNHFLTAQAVFGLARCRELLGQLDAARIVYEEFIASHPDSIWLGRAEDQLASVNKKIDLGPLVAAPIESWDAPSPLGPVATEFQF